MNSQELLRLGVPLDETTRRATDFIAKCVLGGGDKSHLREVVVHRKGATPAGQGAVRVMSRKAANEKFNWKDVNRFLRERGVTLISSGLDEVPMAYKNIREVMEAQRDLVTVLGQFDPKLVKMAPAGERPED